MEERIKETLNQMSQWTVIAFLSFGIGKLIGISPFLVYGFFAGLIYSANRIKK